LEQAMYTYLRNQDFGHLVAEDVHQALAAELVKVEPWVLKLGGTTVPCGTLPTGTAPIWDVPGNQACLRKYINTTIGAGGYAKGWLFFDSVVKGRNIPILYSTPARSLIVNPEGEVIGVLAKDAGGKDVYVKARRGVVLATGGFEANTEMLKHYAKGWPTFYNGSPYDTGDGILMTQVLGAQIVQMNNILAPQGGCVKVKEFEASFAISFGDPHYFYVNKFGQRFINEYKLNKYSFGWQHTILFEKGDATVPTNTWGKMTFPQIPWYAIFDQTVMNLGPLSGISSGWNAIVEGYTWSPKNETELAKGWILKADTLQDLAAKISADPDNQGSDGKPTMDAAALQATFTKYNGYCAAASDPDFGRQAANLVAIKGPPFYALKLWPRIHAMGGGPKRDAKARIINIQGQPIKRLYSAGQMGTWWGSGYDGGFIEGIPSGRIAGRNAAAEKPWGTAT
jgi:hypothetical protein